MKIATYNVNSIRKRIEILHKWIRRHKPDVLCLQETKVQDAEFPLQAFADLPYHINYCGEKSYNGVAIFSRAVPELVAFGFQDGAPREDPTRLARVVVQGIPIINTYVPQGLAIDSPKYANKLAWFQRLKTYFSRFLSPRKPAIWCGDMNVAPDPIDVHSPEKHLKHVCFHEDARRAYGDTASWGFVDVFRHHFPDRQQFTFWDYRRPDALESNRGWRIDHIMVTPALLPHSQTVKVDVNPRKANTPSDHTILWADFSL
ncbi:MAG: exodeoxyribonuclease III [Nitrospirales bacterium]|jgi:exodeoxyribonuclease-3